MPPKLEVFNPCKKLSYMINFWFPRPSLAVIPPPPSFGAATHGIRLPEDKISDAHLLFMSSKGLFLNLHLLIRRQNGPKPLKFHKIRYKSVITQNYVEKIHKIFSYIPRHLLRSVCPNGSKKRVHLACFAPHQN
jgi:hypothetical protein